MNNLCNKNFFKFVGLTAAERYVSSQLSEQDFLRLMALRVLVLIFLVPNTLN